MPTKDLRVDQYIARSAGFAQPILKRLRKIVHQASPKITETLKWGMPAFEYQGLLCNMAAFKQHCTFGFWKQKLMTQAAFPLGKTAMGSFGRITSMADLPSDKALLRLVKQAVQLNEKGVKLVKKSTAEAKKALALPKELVVILRKNKAAGEAFARFNYTHQKEYVDWIQESKTEATRMKRVALTLAWLAEGKHRHWKYEKS